MRADRRGRGRDLANVILLRDDRHESGHIQSGNKAARMTVQNDRRTKRPARRSPVATQAADDHRFGRHLPPRDVFYSRVRRAGTYALALVVITLAVGVVGYHMLEDIDWLDAFHQSALLLSGMGPVVEMTSTSGKLFDSIYAIFCGIILLAATGLLFAPVFHRILHRFHIEDTRDG